MLGSLGMMSVAFVSPFRMKRKSAASCRPCAIKNSRLARASSVSKYAKRIRGRSETVVSASGSGVELCSRSVFVYSFCGGILNDSVDDGCKIL